MQQEQEQAGRGRGWIPQPEAKHQGTAMGTRHGTALCPKRILPSRSIRASPQAHHGPAVSSSPWCNPTAPTEPAGDSQRPSCSRCLQWDHPGSARGALLHPSPQGLSSVKLLQLFFSILLSRKKKYLILCIQLSITLKHDVLVTRLWKQSRAFHLALQPLLRYRVTPESHLGEL